MSQLTLGTAQLGMRYGRVNQAGQPSRELAVAMVRAAIRQGVTTIDTARAYGESEEVLGEALSGQWRGTARVVTKLDPLHTVSDGADRSAVCAAVESSVDRSRAALEVDRLEVLLLHRWEHHEKWDGAAWSHLRRLQADGIIGGLGASVYEPWEALEALRDPEIRHLQIPMNLLDWRWKAAGVDRGIASRPDVVVHARSALLQGILIHPAVRWPSADGFNAGECVAEIESLVRRLSRHNVADLCFAYVRSQAWIQGVVVGCETMEQLNANLQLFRRPVLEGEQCAEVEQALPKAPDAVLNPAKWKQ